MTTRIIKQNNKLQKCIHKIESNIDNELDINQLSALSGYSKFHFLRLFQAYVGEGIYAYRKRLLLERAVKHLLHSQQTITDIAFSCGYQTQSSFNKAFKIQFSYSPSQIRKAPELIRQSTNPIKHTIIIPLAVSYVNIAEIQLIRARGLGTYEQAAKQAWGKLMRAVDAQHSAREHTIMFGVFSDDPDIVNSDNIRYDAAVNISEIDITLFDEISQFTIEKGRYAKFSHTNSIHHLNDAYRYIFNQWLPESGQTLKDTPIFEIYPNKYLSVPTPNKLTAEIYIPILE
jgi:AraC family transcriptional regulator